MNRKLTKEEILMLCEKWERELKVKVKRVQIRKMKNKWGSCSTNGVLTLNKELLELPVKYVEYVIMHEIMHMIIPNHGRTFKTLLYTYMPEWEKIHIDLEDRHSGQN